MAVATHDLLVIGAGPAGYVAAIRAAQLGLNVACVEKESRLGGTCLRVGCIPSKALLTSSEMFHQAEHELKSHGVSVKGVKLDLKAMLKRKDDVVSQLTRGIAGLFKKNKVKHYRGNAEFIAADKVVVHGSDGDQEISAKHVLIATGSQVANLPGIALDDDKIGTSTTALSYPSVPKHLVVIGAGVIGLELGSVWLRLGAQVTVVEYLDRILPGMDDDIAKQAQKVFEKQGFKFLLGQKVTGAHVAENGDCVVEMEGSEPLSGDRVLMAVGRKPNTEGLGLSAAGITCDAKGRIEVNERFETKQANVYAVGDVIAGPMLAHKASEEAIACVEMLVNGWGHINYNAVASVVYTHPEIASVGKTEAELQQAGIPFRKGSFPYAACGRARAMGSTDGMVKILAHAKTDRVLGVHIIGERAGDLIAEAACAIEYGASSEDIARACHAHPTLSEILKEAALAVDGRAIHI